MSDQVAEQSQDLQTNDEEAAGADERSSQRDISLFVKAGSDRECVGCCPFSQRLFMILWLKGVVFNVTTVDSDVKNKELKNLAPGSKPPYLVYGDEILTDISKCEDYIEAELYPPKYPKLACKYTESSTVGNDIFAKFSAFIKYTGDRRSDQAKKLETRLVDSLRKFNTYLMKPLDHEIDADSEDNVEESTRKFIDGNFMTLADCNMLPKLNILREACRIRTGFEIPAEFHGIHRYLTAAADTEEFMQTCPDAGEINWTYGGPKPPLSKAKR